ncbi:MAG: MFS transporter [Caldilineaceae bacterium]|nr:MFS transporter [Caldilineaceae bacterium]
MQRLQHFVYWNRDLGLIYLSMFLWGLGAYLYYYLQPLYVTQLGASPAQVGLALGLGSFVVTFLYAPIGLWADRYGRKYVILLGWVMGTLSAFAMTFAPDWRWFTPALAVYVLSNFAVAVLYGYVTTCTPVERRAEAFALLSSTISLGSIVAPAIGGWIGEQFGLRAVYLTASLIYTGSTLVLLPLRNQAPEPSANRHSASALLHNRAFLGQILLVFFLFFAIDVGLVLAPKYLEEVRGLTINEIGWLGTWSALGVVVLVYGLSKLRGEGLPALLLSLFLVLVGLILLWLGGNQLWLLAVAFVLNGGNRLIRPSVLVRIGSLLRPENLSFGLGIQQTAMQLGLALSPTVAGLLYARQPSWPLYAGIGSVALMLVVTGLVAFSDTTRPLPPTKEQPVGEA